LLSATIARGKSLDKSFAMPSISKYRQKASLSAAYFIGQGDNFFDLFKAVGGSSEQGARRTTQRQSGKGVARCYSY
jgi:hypothetical protein